MARRRVIQESQGSAATSSDTPESVDLPATQVDPRKAAMAEAAERASDFAAKMAANHRARETQNGTTVDTKVPISISNEGETVSATWGEEIFTPRQFCSFRVGPFSGTTTLQPGESRVQAGRRLYEELRILAEETRKAKSQTFMGALRDAFDTAKEKVS